MSGHKEGPGLKVIGRETWYGIGSCGICGDSSDDSLVPVAVSFWDPDDGWRVGVLCRYCGEEAAERGPRDDDYAVEVAKERKEELSGAEKIDAMVSILGDDIDCMIGEDFGA